MTDAEGLDEQAARLRAQSEHMRTKTSQRQQAREWVEKAEASIQGTAASGDGLIRATVDRTGLLTQLELSPKLQRAKPGDLAQVVTAVVQQAAAHARNQVRDLYASLLNEGIIKSLPPYLLKAPDVEQASVTLAPVHSHDDRDGVEPVRGAGSASQDFSGYGYLGRDEDDHSGGPGGDDSGEGSGGDGSGGEDEDGPPSTWLDVRATW